MKKYAWSLIVVFSILFAVFCISLTLNGDQTYIEKWAKESNHNVVNVERCFVAMGPYWIKNKNSRIYKITCDDGSTYWMRTGVVDNEIQKYPTEGPSK